MPFPFFVVLLKKYEFCFEIHFLGVLSFEGEKKKERRDYAVHLVTFVQPLDF